MMKLPVFTVTETIDRSFTGLRHYCMDVRSFRAPQT